MRGNNIVDVTTMHMRQSNMHTSSLGGGNKVQKNIQVRVGPISRSLRVEWILCLYRDWATLKNIGPKITLTLNDIGVKVLLAVGVRSLPLLKHQEEEFL